MELLNHIECMKLALEQAKLAEEKDEIPIGAVLASKKGEVIASSHNLTISLLDPTAHAEILVIRKAAKLIKNYRLTETILYVTLEPCIMCMAAAIHARIKLIVFGADDPKWGAAGSIYDFNNDMRLNHRPEIIKGVMKNECARIMTEFFKKKR